jgi:hypothetical protein
MAKNVERKFTDSEFKAANRLEKIYMTIRQPNNFVLNDTDERYRTLMQQTYPLLVSGRPFFDVVRLVQEMDGGLWKSQAVQLIKDTQELYAAFESIHPKILRGVMREMLMDNIKVLKDIRDDVDMETKERINAANAITKAIDNISKYGKLDKDETESDDFVPFGEMDFDNDIEDVEVEEIQKTLKMGGDEI